MKTILNFIKKNRNIILLSLSFIFLTILILGITYAYLDIKDSGEKESTMIIGGAEISATYSYSNSINISDVIPGDDPIATKDFSITYKNTSNEEYKIYLKAVIDYNTFTENKNPLLYSLYTGTNYSTKVQIAETFPMIHFGKQVLYEIPIPAKSEGTYNYRMMFFFPESYGMQNDDNQLVLKAHLSIESDKSIIYNPVASNYISNLYNLDASSNGLEKDDTSDENIRYVGANPKNYITFNNEIWRIIGVFNVYNVDTNQTEKLVKIIRDESLSTYSWDSSATDINNGYGINEWNQAKLMTELNNDYLDTNKTSGTTLWYSGINNAKNITYDFTKNIKNSAIDKIAKVRWNLGGSTTDSISALNMYNAERGTTHTSNPSDGVARKDYWDGKIGLMYASDYGYASTDTTCRNNMFVGNNNNCKLNNWLSNNTYKWTLTPYSGLAYSAFTVYSDGGVGSYSTNNSMYVNPTLFLKSNVAITGGTGEQNNPYKLEASGLFANDSWKTIANNIKSGNTSLYNVGDEKEVTINGNSYTVRVANNSTPEECNGTDFSQTACGFVVEFVDIVEERIVNPIEQSISRWTDTELYSYLNNEFIKKLPTDLQNVIIDTKVITSYGFIPDTGNYDKNTLRDDGNWETVDKIYLLSKREVMEHTSIPDYTDIQFDSIYNSSRQLDYYKNKGVTDINNTSYLLKMYNGISDWWWLRASTNGHMSSLANEYGPGNYDCYEEIGVAPAFRIG